MDEIRNAETQYADDYQRSAQRISRKFDKFLPFKSPCNKSKNCLVLFNVIIVHCTLYIYSGSITFLPITIKLQLHRIQPIRITIAIKLPLSCEAHVLSL